jgi:hypothetical protein
MATTRGKQISANISNLKAELNLLRAELDKLVKEGASFEEINKKLGVTYENLTNKIAASEAALIKYANANKGNVKRNEELGKSVQKLTQQSDSLRASFNNVASVVQTSVNEAISRNTVIVKKNEAAVEEQANSYKNLRAQVGGYFKGILQQNKVDTQAVNQKERLATATTSFGQAFRTAFSPKAWGSAIASVIKFIGLYQILYGVIEAVKEITIGSIKTFIDFEDSIGRLRAVSGASAEETKVLSESIRQTAVVTRFTATQVTELATSLAKLGASAEDIPGLILPVSLAAQALGADLGEVGETLLKVRNQFGLSTAETVTSANTLIAAVNRSALSLQSFNTAIQYIGPIASQAGLSFSETSAYLETLADNGFSASRIGTGLRGIFIDLKESGVPLIDTLQKLADENISVARATDLVGKRAAAQLITLIDNIQELRRATDENDQYAESLKASAAQMSTTAGQLDILKSAYEELRISIGDVIADSELFLDLIGFLSDDSEDLARGYKALDNVFKSETGFETVSRNVEALAKGTVNAESAFATAFATLATTGQVPDLANAFDAISRANVELKGRLLTTAETFEILKVAGDSNNATFQTYLREIGLAGPEAKKLNDALLENGVTLDGIQNQVSAAEGLAGIFESQALAIQESNQASEERLRIEQLYEEQVKKVIDLGPQTNQGLEETRRLQKELNDEIKKAEEERDAEREKGILGNKVLINQLEGRISGYKNIKKELSDLGYINEEDAKEAEAAKKAQFKSDSETIKRKEAQIKDELKRIKSIRDARVREAEERAKLERDAAQTVEERAQVEINLINSISAANADAQEMAAELTDDINDLANESANLAEKYKEDAFSEPIDKLSDSVNGLFGDLANLQRDATITLSGQAINIAEAGTSVLQEYGQELDKLKEKYGENYEVNKDFINESNLLTDVTIENLKNLLRGIDLTSQEGQLLEKIINEQISKLENFGENAKDKLKEVYVDGLGEALDAALKALDRFNDVAFENTKDRIDREKEQVESRYELESDILKSQLDNQLITEEEYRNKQQKLRRKQIGEENALEKALFDAQQKRDRQSATSDYLQAIASIIPELIKDGIAEPITLTATSAITAAIATASYGAELSAISQRKFIPKKFAEGGFVNGPSHADGGVPFTVRGMGGYEMEGGEFIVNKRAAQLHKTVLERINNSSRPTIQNGRLMFETGGSIPVNGVSISKLQSGTGSAEATIAQLDYLRAIAETNVTISQNTSKPVRAYVSATDLQSNATERKIKERNTQV